MNRLSQPQLRHLYSRAAFGATPAQLGEADGQPLRKVIRTLFADSHDYSPLTLDEDVTSKREARQLMRDGMLDKEQLKLKIREAALAQRDLNVQWVDRMAGQKGALREKMALFWHNHFACRINQRPRLVQHYVNTLRQHALGNFGEMLLAVSKTPAMLQFLNNQQNRKNAPNENFAREVMELFTLGKGTAGSPNYTENDIKEAARAFTGWGYSPEGEFVFRQRQHDEGEKTIFSQTGTFQGDDVLKLLLKNPQTARYVTTKLYRELVSEQVDEQRVAELSRRFYKSNYDITDLLETIFAADWFYDAKNVGAHIKSPVELLAGVRHLVGVTFGEPQPQVFIQRTLGQLLLYPPNVAGWPGGTNWIDSSSLLFRMKLPDYIFKNAQVAVQTKEDGDVNLQPIDNKGGKQFTAKVDWPGFEQPFLLLTPDKLPDALATCLLPWPLTAEQKKIVTDQLKPAQPVPDQIRTLTVTIMSLPEFQLS